MPSSSPSPTDNLKSSHDDRRHLRPIGTERAHKKSPGPGAPGGPGAAFGGMGDAALWMFTAELGPREWLNEHQSLPPGLTGSDNLRLGAGFMESAGHESVPGLTDPSFTVIVGVQKLIIAYHCFVLFGERSPFV